jgi:SpoVK/Ycf46/Vps4 family AAA+-type ATPase
MVDLPDLQSRTQILSVTLANNRLGDDVDLEELARKLEGYSGSDIKEVCREAVVRVSHEQAMFQEKGDFSSMLRKENIEWSSGLRPVMMKDFQYAMKKLKASVNESGKEMSKVVEWNDKYGEIKRKSKKDLSHLSMYI